MADNMVSFTRESGNKMKDERIKYLNDYMRENAVRVALSLSRKSDADIIEYLETVENKTGTIKQAIREQMKKEGAE